MRTTPPALVRRLLRAVLGRRAGHEVLGDLDEEFHTFMVPELGPSRARAWYRAQVARSILPILRHRMRRSARGATGRQSRESRMRSALQDLRFSLRSFRRRPLFTLGVVLTLALGIGATTAVYSVVDGMILNPFPFPEADRVIAVGTEYPRLGTALNFVEHLSPPEYIDIRDQTRTLESLVSWDMGNRQVSTADASENLFSGFWWGDGFEPLGVTPHLGRGMTMEETVRGDAVAVLSHRVWLNRFGADSTLVGGTISMNGNPFTVVGIMPEGVVLNGMDLWIPMPVGPEVIPREARQWQVMGRLREGATLAELNTELEAIARRTEQAYGREMEEYGGWRMQALTWTDANVRAFRGAGFILMGAVGFVLLLVCSNVASFLLARAAGRRREMAVRTAMGAGRGRLARQVLTESIGLAAVGGVVGVGVAWLATRGAAGLIAQIPFLPGTVELNGRVLFFAMCVTLLTGVVFGLAPAIQSSRAAIQSTLGSEATATTGSGRRLRVQRVVVAVEAGLALVLLIGGGLMVNTLVRLAQADTGFEPDRVMTMRLTLPWEDYDGPAIGAFFATLEEEVRSVPGVVAVGRGSQFPPLFFSSQQIEVEGLDAPVEGQLPSALATLASPGYFAALGIPLVRGRAFNDLDVEGTPLVAVVNQVAVDRLFGGADPVGTRIRTGDDDTEPWLTVVGVVGDAVNNGIDSDPLPEVFANHRQVPGWLNQMYLLVRTEGPPESVVAPVRAAVAAIDPDQPIYQITSASDRLAGGVAQRRVAAMVLGLFALFALALASGGVFAVVAFAVGERTREIGLRVALGARGSEVRRLMVRQALLPVTIGAALGLVAAIALGQALADLLFQVSATDPVTLTVVTLTFLGVAAAASYIPASRASRLDPVAALRGE